VTTAYFRFRAIIAVYDPWVPGLEGRRASQTAPQFCL